MIAVGVVVHVINYNIVLVLSSNEIKFENLIIKDLRSWIKEISVKTRSMD